MAAESAAAIPCAHAIYGSESGLGDYAILAVSDGVDSVARDTFSHYASLGGRALREPFAPIYSFFAIDATRRAFARTVCLAQASRGNDYLVHAIFLDDAALARLEYRPFVLEDARMFTSAKPAAATRLPMLRLDASRKGDTPVPAAYRASIAACLRALARGSLRLRVDEDRFTASVCRVVYDALPASDRQQTTFCSRFSYGRRLSFRLAAFVAADEADVRAQASDAAIIAFPPPAAPPGGNGPDAFDRWMAADRVASEFAGVSLLNDPAGAVGVLADIDTLRQCGAGTLTLTEDELRALRPAAHIVARPENRHLVGEPRVLIGAAVVDLWSQIQEAIDKPASLRDCAAMCRSLQPDVWRAALSAVRQMRKPTGESWIAERLLLLSHATPEQIQVALCPHGDRLIAMCKERRTLFDAFADVVNAALRDRFGAKGAGVAVRVAETLFDDREALFGFVRTMESVAAADADRERQVAWLMAIVRDVSSRADLAPEAAARIILTFGLLPHIADVPVLTRVAPVLLARHEALAKALTAIDAGGAPALACLLESAVRQQRRLLPAVPGAIDLVYALLLGATRVVAAEGRSPLIAWGTQFIYRAAAEAGRVPNPLLTAAIASAAESFAGAGINQSEGAILHKALYLLRRATRGVSLVTSETCSLLEAKARQRAKQGDVWTVISTHRRVRLLNMAGT